MTWSEADPRLVFWPEMDRIPCPAPTTPTPDTALHERLRRAIQRELTPRQRQVVELTYFQGCSQRETAARLGVSQQVVHKCLHGTKRRGRTIGGALKRLRAALVHP
jgi:RNA polymerase sigma factor (sigma-70 family)